MSAPYIGDFAASVTIRQPYPSNDQSGAAALGALGTIRIYKDDSDTQRTSASGVTHTRSKDSIVGINFLTVDLSDNADAGFYATGHDYWAALITETIDGVSVSVPLFSWSIQNRYSAAPSAASILTTQMTEAYAADGVAPTLAQALFLLLAVQTEKSISATTLTAKKLDGTTTAATFTLDSATSPTSITRAS